MINGGNKKPERGSPSAIQRGAAGEAQRIAAALARAESRVPANVAVDKPQQAPKADLNPRAKPAIPAPRIERPPEPRIERPQGDRDMGFDPYNSGSFDRKHAWSKVGKR